jgi:hypothetical protein
MDTNLFDCCLPGCKASNNSFLGINWWFFLEVWFGNYPVNGKILINMNTGSKQFWKTVFLIDRNKQQEQAIIDSYQQQ